MEYIGLSTGLINRVAKIDVSNQPNSKKDGWKYGWMNSMHTCKHARTCTHIHTHTHMYACTHAQTHKYTHTYSRMHACTHTHTHTCMHTHTCTCMHAHPNKYTHTHPPVIRQNFPSNAIRKVAHGHSTLVHKSANISISTTQTVNILLRYPTYNIQL
jgi:hypothetical protein